MKLDIGNQNDINDLYQDPDPNCKHCNGKGYVVFKDDSAKKYLIERYGDETAKSWNYQYDDLCDCVIK